MSKKCIAGGKFGLLDLLRNWVHQALFYMDTTERGFRIVVEVIAIFVIAFIFAKLAGDNYFSLWIMIASLLVAHTINWILNGNWWACILFAFPKLRNRGQVATCWYLNKMAERLRDSSSISGILIFGSVSRGEWHNRSDIDLRLLRRRGVFYAISAMAIQMRERLVAFFNRQPLDMYMADDIDFLMKMNKDESPIFLKKRDSRLEQAYPSGKETRLRRLM